MHPRMLLLPALAAALAAGAPAAPAPRPPLVVTVVARDYRFELPATLPAGLTTFRLVNRGRRVHHLALLRLPRGRTLAEVRAALTAGGAEPRWLTDAGGPNALDPGNEAEVVVELQPGRYVLACFVPAADGAPGLAHGMLRELTVTPARGQAAPEPAPDDTVTFAGYGFRLSAPLTPGEHRLLVRNADTQSHELVLFRLEPGKTAAQFLAWAEAMRGPAPGAFEGGVSGLAPGQENEAIVELHHGRYVLACFLAAPDGKPHTAHGMVAEVRVQD